MIIDRYSALESRVQALEAFDVPTGIVGLRNTPAKVTINDTVNVAAGMLMLQATLSNTVGEYTALTWGNVNGAPLSGFKHVRTAAGEMSLEAIVQSGSSTSLATGKTMMRISGNGGIYIGGASAPTATLEVARGTLSGGTARFVGTNYASHFNYSTNEDTYIRGGKAVSQIIIGDNNTGNILVTTTSGGNIGLRTQAPTRTVTIGDVATGSAFLSYNLGASELWVTGCEYASGQNRYIIYNSAGAGYAVLVSSVAGYMGLGLGGALATYRLELPNFASASGQGRANAWVTYSSATRKEQITALTADHRSKARQLKVVSFKWRADQAEQPARDYAYESRQQKIAARLEAISSRLKAPDTGLEEREALEAEQHTLKADQAALKPAQQAVGPAVGPAELGLIAEDVLGVFPELVTGDPADPASLGVKESKAGLLALALVQQLYDEVDALKARSAAGGNR